ncbi:MAG: transcriptional repressor [Bacteroidales bacterium]|nr:transcriptional repressor [Bacteroidales bacterium]
MGFEKIINAGLKTTVQRIAILDFLENSDVHPSAEMVFNYITEKYPTVTLSTVYNTLEKFVENKIINKVFTIQGKARYDAKNEKHHHLFDKNTGEFIDVFDDGLNDVVEKYLKEHKISNFKIDDFQINFTGKI